MNCGRFQKLLFEYAEGSLSMATHEAAEHHLANCSTCRQIARQHQVFSRSLADGFHRDAASIAFSSEDQHRLIVALQQQPVNVPVRHVILNWWSRLAWIGASAAVLVIGLFVFTGLPFRSTPRAPRPDHVPNRPMLVRFSYCEPGYTFRREADFVTDSISCNPRTIEQTLWLANQKPVKPATKSEL